MWLVITSFVSGAIYSTGPVLTSFRKLRFCDSVVMSWLFAVLTLKIFWIPHRFHHTGAVLFLRGHSRTKHNAHTSPLSTCVVLNRTWTANTMMKTSNLTNKVRECERNWHHFCFIREGSLHSSNVSHWIRKPECRSLKGINFIVAFTWRYKRAHFFPSIF